MPKFYIRTSTGEKCIIDASDARDACVKALEKRILQDIIVNGRYWVSEKGFDIHPHDDYSLLTNEINEMYRKKKNL